MNGIAKKNASCWIFLLVQITLYLTFLTLDISGGNVRLSVGIKYTIIILCFCYALFSKGVYKGILFFRAKLHNYQRVDIILLQAGLFFTLISDLFILILDYYIYGVLTFILVQQLYGLRLMILVYEGRTKDQRSCEGSMKRIALLYRNRLLIHTLIACLLYLVLHQFDIEIEGLLVVSVFYFITILSNTISAIRLVGEDRKNRSNLIYAVGMLLFLLCDINVGLFNLTGFIAMPEDIYSVIFSFSSILMWTFYAPSQVLIAMSIHYVKPLDSENV